MRSSQSANSRSSLVSAPSAAASRIRIFSVRRYVSKCDHSGEAVRMAAAGVFSKLV